MIRGNYVAKICLMSATFKKAFSKCDVKEGLLNDGILCYDALSCIQLTFEHELVHALLSCACPEHESAEASPTSQLSWKGKVDHKSKHSRVFMSILNNIF